MTVDIQEFAQNVGQDLDVESTVESVRRESARALDIACNKTADLTEAALNADIGTTAQEFSEAAVAKAQMLQETILARTRDVGETANDLLGEDIAGRAQETAQVA